jgi:SAM-dependent methyltransferase
MSGSLEGQATGGLLSPYLERQRILHGRKHVPDYASILDIGCGRATLLSWLPRIHSYTGIDLDEEVISMVSEAYPEHHFYRMNIESDALPFDGTFSVIVMLAVLEHFSHPVETMRRIVSCMRNDGRIILTTPHSSARKIHDVGSSIGIFSKEAAEEHNVFFDKNLLENLARDCGCIMVNYERFQFGFNQAAVFHRKV